MPATFEALMELLDLTAISHDVMQGPTPATTMQRLFGGQVLAQSLIAAGRTMDSERLPHSLHGYFLRAGNPHLPLQYEVERTRDGRSFSTRRVIATQDKRAIFQLIASFQIPEDGYEHQESMPENILQPNELPSIRERIAERGDGVSINEWDALEVAMDSPSSGDDYVLRAWFRTAKPMPDDPLLHAAVMAYASDLTMVSAAMSPHGIRPGDLDVVSASIDHAMWFHRPGRADEWLFHDHDAVSSSSGRGLARGRVFDQTGRLVATTVQEVVMRPRRR
jgi:acyl-CoA thioesterase-2